ncbi:hypothetical protein FRC09_004743 [Ceratobasidium sp. 395]|nr:hypothetical protein FRC09_004743 [Ceratobasidium sp. 395]
MHIILLLFFVYFSALVTADSFALPPDFHRFAPRQQGIKWGPCDNDNSTRVCGQFEVPLDYGNAAAGTASLKVIRYPAFNTPKLGTLFVNPGGPGGSGVDYILGSSGTIIMTTAGGSYDIVSWDPRGVGGSLPRVGCFSTGTEANQFWGNSPFRVGVEARGNFTDPADLQAFYAQEPNVDRQLIAFGQKCLQYSPDTLQYIGTAAAVRDMVALHDYLEGPDKPVNFWGLSYGTAVGIYFVNMFPNRVGRVVLDGVVDPIYWANRPPHEASCVIWAINVESADEALTGFIQTCAIAGPGNCAIAVSGSTPVSLREWVQQLIDLAYDYKKAAGANAQFGSFDIRVQVFQGMYGPATWRQLAVDLKTRWDHLVTFMSNTSTKRSNQTPEPAQRSTSARNVDVQTRQTTPGNPDPPPDYAFQAITCADAVDPGDVTTKMVFDELVRVTREVSSMFGPRGGIAGFYCHHWPVRAVERFTGPWNSKLSNSLLVIGNEADPITPFRSAKSVADALGDSAVLVEQDDYGHSSLAMHSDCTFNILRDYFVNNQLPTADQFCGTNQVLFPGGGITKSSLAALNVNNNSSSSTDIQSQLYATQTRVRQLFGAIIALASALGLLLVFIIGSWILGKKSGKDQKDVVYWGKEDLGNEKEQGHTYNTPYDGVTALKLGGYKPVKA